MNNENKSTPPPQSSLPSGVQTMDMSKMNDFLKADILDLVPLSEEEYPSDAEVEKWFTENIDANCSASSAIYKFRLWLKDRYRTLATPSLPPSEEKGVEALEKEIERLKAALDFNVKQNISLMKQNRELSKQVNKKMVDVNDLSAVAKQRKKEGSLNPKTINNGK